MRCGIGLFELASVFEMKAIYARILIDEETREGK
jgi:hypothetical protein